MSDIIVGLSGPSLSKPFSFHTNTNTNTNTSAPSSSSSSSSSSLPPPPSSSLLYVTSTGMLGELLISIPDADPDAYYNGNTNDDGDDDDDDDGRKVEELPSNMYHMAAPFLRSHTGPVVGVAAHSNAQELFTIGLDRTVRVWDLDTHTMKEVILLSTDDDDDDDDDKDKAKDKAKSLLYPTAIAFSRWSREVVDEEAMAAEEARNNKKRGGAGKKRGKAELMFKIMKTETYEVLAVAVSPLSSSPPLLPMLDSFPEKRVRVKRNKSSDDGDNDSNNNDNSNNDNNNNDDNGNDNNDNNNDDDDDNNYLRVQRPWRSCTTWQAARSTD